jgi:serine-type D-Ala-D-Ala carboxypeptidase (penicillin-binding protein 5/6)
VLNTALDAIGCGSSVTSGRGRLRDQSKTQSTREKMYSKGFSAGNARGPDRPRLLQSLRVGAAAMLLAVSGAAAARSSRALSHDPYPFAAASYLATVDGQVLWSHDIDTHRAPASLTKLLTALVLLDSHWSPDTILTVSHEAAHIEPERVGLRTGERVRAEDALTAMLVHSANDACMALVENAAPSLDVFAQRMNARATQLGMKDSHFVHPCGYDQPGQYSTARDLLRLALAAHSNPVIAEIAARSHASIRTIGGRELKFKSTNQLLGRLEGVSGLKTGYTSQAGKCLIAVAQQNGHRVWLVLLDSHKRWWIAHRMILDAFTAAARTPRTAGLARR